MIGYMVNNVLPLRAGEFVRVYVVARRWGHGFWTALATLIVTHVDVEETGAASGVNNVARTLGAAVGTQIGAALLVTGGSQGARNLNQAVWSALDDLCQRFEEVVHIAGRQGADGVGCRDDRDAVRVELPAHDLHQGVVGPG